MRLTPWICAAVLFGCGERSGADERDLPVETPQEAVDACRMLEDAQRRLACYDAIPGATVTGGPAEVATAAGPATAPAQEERRPEDGEPADELWIFRSGDGIPLARSPMMRRWELDDATHGGLFRIRAYNPIYALPARWSSSPNERPESPTLGAPENPDQLDDIEAKFQFSLKTKLWDNLLGGNGDVWVGFTQQSNWQAYNSLESEPFRETNYAPEVFTSWRTGLDLPGFRWQMINFGFVHQSNGESEPFSRSWNRVYALLGFERGPWELYVRPWLRVEEEERDDNPDIEDFLGHGDVRLKWRRNKHDLGLLARWVPGENRGALQFDWHYPLVGDLKAYLQFFHGYGETLIDYNHRQTTIGLGVSLVQ